MVAQTTNSACASDGSNLYQDPRYIAGIMHMVVSVIRAVESAHILHCNGGGGG